MAYPDKINALVDVTADQTLAAGGHAARHNDVNDALDELKAVFTAPAANELALRPDGSTERVRLTSGGSVLIGTTSGGSAGAGDLVVNGGVFLGGNAAANELDDYEEGTWTPTVFDATTGGNQATASRRGRYTKVGRIVHVMGDIRNINTTGMTSANPVYVRDLPFTKQTDLFVVGAADLSRWFLAGSTGYVAQIGSGTDNFCYFVSGSGGTGPSEFATVGDVGVSGASDIWFSISYIAA